MHTKSPRDIAKAARDSAGIEAAMRRAVAKAIDERRKLGLPIVADDSNANSNAKNNGRPPK